MEPKEALGQITVTHWQEDLVRDGFVLFEGMCPFPTFLTANQAIDDDLEHHYDPERQEEYDHRSYCPELRKTPAISALLTESGAKGPLNSLFGFRNLRHHDGQIAIRRPHNARQPQPPTPHIDGVATPHNGMRKKSLQTFTALIGVFLSETPSTFAGNFTVWPGSHLRLQEHFRHTGRAALRAGVPNINLGAPQQLITRPGDVILCHYLLAHAAAVNCSDIERRAVFFRIWQKGLALRRWHHLTNIWQGWRVPPATLHNAQL